MSETPPEGNVHSIRSGRILSKEDAGRFARAQERNRGRKNSSEGYHKSSRRPLSQRIIEKTLSHPKALKKVAIGAVTAATAALGVHELGQAIDAEYKLGKYAPDKTTTTAEHIVKTQAEDVEANEIFNGTLAIIIKTDNDSKLAVRFKPDIPEKSKLESTEVDWNDIMALKSDNRSPETYIHNKNSFQISGTFKLVDGYDPVTKSLPGGSWFRLIAVMKDGTEQNVFLNRSEFTEDHIEIKGSFSSPDEKIPTRTNE